MEGYFIVIPDVYPSETIVRTTFVQVFLVFIQEIKLNFKKKRYYFLEVLLLHFYIRAGYEEIEFLLAKCLKRKSKSTAGQGG